jgi:D-alanyl-lipoteichoic acid acyltransferase DltB (MBOAT superfamily)
MIAGREAFSVDSIFLPVGISFFTFQAMSYVIDIFRRKSKPVRNFLDFGFYLSFFPQLVAGPIVRPNQFLPQLHKPFFLGRKQFGIAVFWIMNGLAKKLILSDYIAVNFCDRVFENPLLYTGFENLTAIFGYSLQVYADFSGYTDIATGVAMLMGFYLPKNFDSPYKAKNASEFWKRWHISLSKWLQDYLYIPLGGNRNGTIGSYAIILGIAFMASALAKNWWVFFSVLLLTAVIAFFIIFKKKHSQRADFGHQQDGHHASGWSLARAKLEFHDLGWAERLRNIDISFLEVLQRVCESAGDRPHCRTLPRSEDGFRGAGVQPVFLLDVDYIHRRFRQDAIQHA